jgi:hypothetical protein
MYSEQGDGPYSLNNKLNYLLLATHNKKRKNTILFVV